jgi:glycosyltransferase involved in cell wall biosynthesis
MASALLRLLDDGELAERLAQAGLKEAQRYDWPQVRGQWLAAYRRCAAPGVRT